MSKPSGIRQQEMLSLLRSEGRCTISALCEHFGISVPTAHRDINALASSNEIRKVHGGVEYVPPSQTDQSWNSSFEVRINRHRARKQKIAQKALALLRPDDVIFLDSSTTALYLARALAQTEIERLTIVTNSASIASEFHRFPTRHTLVSIGGVYNHQLNSFLGGIARATLANLRISKVFFSAVGIDGDSAFTYHEDHATLLRELLESSDTGILLADSSKFSRQALFRIRRLEDIDHIISDKPLPAGILK